MKAKSDKFFVISLLASILLNAFLFFLLSQGENSFSEFVRQLFSGLAIEILGAIIGTLAFILFVSSKGKSIDEVFMSDDNKINLKQMHDMIEIIKTKYEENSDLLNIEWSNLHNDVRDLVDIVKIKGLPDVVLTPGVRGATILNLLSSYLKSDTKFIIGETFSKETLGNKEFIAEFRKRYRLQYIEIETSSALVYFPKIINTISKQDVEILIVDDIVSSGAFLTTFKKNLIQAGFNEEKISTLTIAVSDVAINKNIKPDYYKHTIIGNNFSFPWRRFK